MIKLNLEIKNPWSKNRFKNLGCISGRLTKNNGWELQHTFYDGMLLDNTIEWKRRCDHAGLEVVFGLLGYAIHFRIYDRRHWDHDNNIWKEYD